ncbi:MAG: hypothetical protein IT546_07050 [Caulobacteraceae bacterium]|nr:hypothetical protein [Caulobacteraceae bacterium]
MDDSLTSGLLLSLRLDPRLRGLRAVEGGAVALAVRAVIAAAAQGAGGEAVLVRARAQDDEVEIAVAHRAAASPPPASSIRRAACAARRAGASLSVASEDGRLVWRLALFAPQTPPAVLLVSPDPYRQVELASMLEGLGYRGETAGGEREMLGRLAAEPYAALVVDLEQDEQAVSVLCRLARAARWPPLLALAGADAALSRGTLQAAGFAGVIVRPLIGAQVAAALAAAGLQSKRPNS